MKTAQLTREILSKLLSATSAQNPIGSLSNLRIALQKMSFESAEEGMVAKDLAAQAHLNCFNLDAREVEFAESLFAEAGNLSMLEEISRLKALYSRVRTGNPSVPGFLIDEQFRAYCENHGMVILRAFQEGIDRARRCSWVYLVLDSDGIVKIYKEILDWSSSPLGDQFSSEDELYATLPPNPYFPKVYGTIDCGGIRFLRQSFHYGRPLTRYIDNHQRLSWDDASWVIQGVAQALEFVHAHGLAYLDIKPENILLHPSGIRMLDLGVARKVEGVQELDIYLADPRFGTPEGGTRLKGSKQSDIFQMGILYHLLRYARHPFEVEPLQVDNLDTHRESAILRYFWPTTVLNYQADSSDDLRSSEQELLAQMLEKDPAKRPTASEVLRSLSQNGRRSFAFSRVALGQKRPKEIVLFPARAAIPHKGHIEYISRLCDLGYHVLISLQRAHTLTKRDPIPKSLVMKMVAQSLIDLGFVPGVDFSFVFTPFYKTKEELEYHFATLPQIEDVVAVASSNPEVKELFPGWIILDQRAIYASEGEEWDVRSWGESLRRAVRDGDYDVFSRLAASGVEQILSFEQLGWWLRVEPVIEFVPKVEAVLLQDGKELVRGRVFRYHCPEQSLVRHMKGVLKWKVKLVDLYSKDTLLEVDGQLVSLSYISTGFDPTIGLESVYFRLIHA